MSRMLHVALVAGLEESFWLSACFVSCFAVKMTKS